MAVEAVHTSRSTTATTAPAHSEPTHLLRCRAARLLGDQGAALCKGCWHSGHRTLCLARHHKACCSCHLAARPGWSPGPNHRLQAAQQHPHVHQCSWLALETGTSMGRCAASQGSCAMLCWHIENCRCWRQTSNQHDTQTRWARRGVHPSALLQALTAKALSTILQGKHSKVALPGAAGTLGHRHRRWVAAQQ